MASLSLSLRGLVLQIQVNEIPEEGLELQVDDSSWFPDGEIRRTGDLKARVFIERQQERLMASGSIDLVYLLDCDRCLEEYHLPQRIEFRLILEQEEKADVPLAAEHQYDINEMDVVFYEGTLLDIDSILVQQVLLAHPAKKLCKDDCSGLCSECGMDLNLGTCTCSEKNPESPFSVLGQLINK